LAACKVVRRRLLVHKLAVHQLVVLRRVDPQLAFRKLAVPGLVVRR